MYPYIWGRWDIKPPHIVYYGRIGWYSHNLIIRRLGVRIPPGVLEVENENPLYEQLDATPV